nr:murein biosynthesis integral membrane protein MurJ [Nakamurella aerolata]
MRLAGLAGPSRTGAPHRTAGPRPGIGADPGSRQQPGRPHPADPSGLQRPGVGQPPGTYQPGPGQLPGSGQPPGIEQPPGIRQRPGSLSQPGAPEIPGTHRQGRRDHRSTGPGVAPGGHGYRAGDAGVLPQPPGVLSPDGQPGTDSIQPDPEHVAEVADGAAAQVGAAGQAGSRAGADDTSKTARTGGVVRAGGMMAVATLTSRLTGFVAKAALAAWLGLWIVNDSYTLANTLPNIVFELVVGGVLTSVAIPLLSRARSDPDGGTAYTQRLMTMAIVGLLGVTVIAVVLAPYITSIYMKSDSHADRELATQLARLLLPEIFFYGLAALFGAILNTKERFAAPAWAPLVNNLVVIATAGVLFTTSGQTQHLGPNGEQLGLSAITPTQLLILGLGTTLGIVVQALVMLPSLLRSGFRFRWRWGSDERLAEAGGLLLWSIGYALISAVSYVVVSRVATGQGGALSTYAYASMLFQMPYGILGVSVLTAIMPRMSRHAADGNIEAVKDDASLANRLSAITLGPITAAMVAMALPLAFLTYRGTGASTSAPILGHTLMALALGLVPLAITLVQMRVFYAMKDARTPTLINAVMVGIRIPLILLCGQLPDEAVAPGIAAATSLSYVIGAAVGEIWLTARYGRMGTWRLFITLCKVGLASVVAGVVAWIVLSVLGVSNSLLELVIGSIVGVMVVVPLLLMLRIPEVEPLRRRLGTLFGFPTGR